MSEPGRGATGPLTVLSAGAAALARSTDLDGALAVIVEAGRGRVGARWRRCSARPRPVPPRAAAHARHGGRAGHDAFESDVADDPAHPIHRAALDRTGTLGRTWTAEDGSSVTFADLPLVVASGGVEACVGVLTFGWEGAHEVGTAEETLLVAIADLAAAAIASFRTSSMATERAEWVERVAHTDPLTGLSNARTLGRVLELEVARAQRQGSEVSVAMFDVDGFTALNEASGSRAGDQVLRQVATVLAETVRLVDTVARTGGDEFVVVAPGSAGVHRRAARAGRHREARGDRGAPGQRERRHRPLPAGRPGRGVAPRRPLARRSRRPAETRRSSRPPASPAPSGLARRRRAVAGGERGREPAVSRPGRA